MKVGLTPTGIVMPTTNRPLIPTAAATLTSKNPAVELNKLNKLLSGDPINIAVIRSGGGIGDVLMTFPTVKALKKKYSSKLTYVTDIEYLAGALVKCAQHNPYIDEILDYRHFREEHYDIVINLTCPCIAHEVPKAPPIHRIDLFSRSCGINLSDRQIDYQVTEEEIRWGAEFLATRNLNPNHTILVQPYASNPRRSYEIRQLQKALVLAGQANDNLRFLILRHSSDFDKDSQWEFRHMVPMKDYDIACIASVLHHCPMVITPDSALLHLAGALSKKIVAFFGPTDYRARMYDHMRPICPGEILPAWPLWYSGDDRIAQETWRMLTPEMLAIAIIEEYNSLSLSQSKILNPSRQFQVESI